MRLFEAIFRFFVAKLSDKTVEKKYARAGEVFGDVVSYIYMGECVGFKRMLKSWARWEREYARRGYRTLILDAFVDSGGYGMALDGLGTKRGVDELPIFHAQIYAERFLGKIKPIINFEEMKRTRQPQCGTYFLPSERE